jgi:hypothetical protein
MAGVTQVTDPGDIEIAGIVNDWLKQFVSTHLGASFAAGQNLLPSDAPRWTAVRAFPPEGFLLLAKND